MRKIAVVTGNRAEYGLLKNIIDKINTNPDLELILIVTGTHLIDKYGYSIKDIIDDGFKISEKIDIVFASNNSLSITKSVGLAIIEFANCLERFKPDILLILGDRYEIYAAASAAMLLNIPIAHISGGEITEGAQDEQIRHAITKMAHIHFPATEIYANNIKMMGEEEWRIFNVGDPGIENIKRTKFIDLIEIKKIVGFDVNDKTLLVTFHPVTLELDLLEYQIQNLISAIEKVNLNTIITYPNGDAGSDLIINKFNNLAKKKDNIKLFKNLGSVLYLSIMKNCGVVVGNSSSGIVEAPYFKVPVVNIGSRQKGRLKAKNIIDCGYSTDEIFNAIQYALSSEFKEICKSTMSLYGVGDTSDKIVEILKTINIDEKLLKKRLVWS